MIIQRNLEAPLKRMATQMPVVAVTGPRQSGKTTLCRSAFPDKPYVSLEPLDVREYAVNDPRGFLEEYGEGAIFDEVQRAPDLLSYLQVDVDERPDPGRFILTGSQQFPLSEAITQSLAGRIALLTLLPPSLDEIKRFNIGELDLWDLVRTGSFPRIYDRQLDPTPWLADYVTTYVQRDVRQVLNITNLEAFTTFLRLAAGRTATEISLSGLGADAGVSHPTVRAWFSVLEASFVVHRLPAWHRNQRKQIIKSAKVHFLDSGLACYLLGINETAQLRHHPLRGPIFESWVVSEVLKWRRHRGLPSRAFHYRESRGMEVDFLIEEGNRLIAAEVKSGATFSSDSMKHLRRLTADLEEERPSFTVDARVIFGGHTGQRRRLAAVIPWHSIQDFTW